MKPFSIKFVLKLVLFLCLPLAFLSSCEVKNPDNFTLTGGGFTGIYSEFNDLSNERGALVSVANKWGITLGSIGCAITNEASWEMTKSNYEANRNLKRKYGRNWLEKFKNEVRSEHKKRLLDEQMASQ